jgi:hypothetical protein
VIGHYELGLYVFLFPRCAHPFMRPFPNRGSPQKEPRLCSRISNTQNILTTKSVTRTTSLSARQGLLSGSGVPCCLLLQCLGSQPARLAFHFSCSKLLRAIALLWMRGFKEGLQSAHIYALRRRQRGSLKVHNFIIC